MLADPSRTLPTLLARSAGILGWLAIACLSLWGVGLLLGLDAITPVGMLGDVLLTLECLLALPMLLELHRQLLRPVGAASLLALPVGTAGLVGLALAQTMHLMRLIGLSREAPIAFLAMLLIALWLALAGWIGFRAGLLSGKLAWAGSAACFGVILLLGCAGSLAADPATRTLSGNVVKAHASQVLGAAVGLLLWGVAFAVWMQCAAIEPARGRQGLNGNTVS